MMNGMENICSKGGYREDLILIKTHPPGLVWVVLTLHLYRFTPRCCRSWRDIRSSVALQCAAEPAVFWGWLVGNRQTRRCAPSSGDRGGPFGCTGQHRRTQASPRQTPGARWTSASKPRASWSTAGSRTRCYPMGWRPFPRRCTFAVWRTASARFALAWAGSALPGWRRLHVGSWTPRSTRCSQDRYTQTKRWLSNLLMSCDCILLRETPYRGPCGVLGHQDHHSGPTANETQ